uniref:Uncharacterized protein n=1 Tax=Arundo donax TaxID=35708 RepID=A0A0A8YB08_ARUDO
MMLPVPFHLSKENSKHFSGFEHKCTMHD